MNFVFAADNNYLPHFETVLKSVMCYHENVYIFLLMNEEPSAEFVAKINYYLAKRHSKFFYYVLNETDFAGLQAVGRFTNMMFARYFISRLFPYQQDNHWCYLDIDIVVNENLTHVFDLMQNPAQNRTEQNRTEQNRTEQNRTEQNRTEQNRTACLMV
ncbi:glycosyltransferase [Lonepinella sp. BR2357]|uniref:glycosyltransferase n=1 Tax=Lonepinella sp. BR2357 TaxID=3434549 RepID=UPI003F6DE241